MAGPQHGAIPADGNQQIKLAVFDTLPQGGIIHFAIGGFQAVLFQIGTDRGGFCQRVRNFGICGDDNPAEERTGDVDITILYRRAAGGSPRKSDFSYETLMDSGGFLT